jgi:TolB-like protein
MGRLRQLLAEYYAETGADDPWQLYLPRGSYTLRLVENNRESASSHPLPSVAVARFDNLLQDPERNWFCDGMTLELIHLLTQNAHLRIVVPHTFFPMPWRIGQSVKLTTDYELVCGVAMKATGKKPHQYEFQLTATLNEVAGKRTLWSLETDKRASINTMRGALETIATKTWEFVVAPHAPVAPLPKGKLRWQYPE